MRLLEIGEMRDATDPRAETCLRVPAGTGTGADLVTPVVREQQPAGAPTASNRGRLHENAVAPYRSAVSLLHLAE